MRVPSARPARMNQPGGNGGAAGTGKKGKPGKSAEGGAVDVVAGHLEFERRQPLGRRSHWRGRRDGRQRWNRRFRRNRRPGCERCGRKFRRLRRSRWRRRQGWSWWFRLRGSGLQRRHAERHEHELRQRHGSRRVWRLRRCRTQRWIWRHRWPGRGRRATTAQFGRDRRYGWRRGPWGSGRARWQSREHLAPVAQQSEEPSTASAP